LVPRQGYYKGGPTDKIPADYSPEADMPSPNAQEAGLVSGDAPKYLISPQNREDMEPHWQSLINRIYGGEGGYDKSGQPRYNIRQGGKETFDIEAGHPGKRPAQGGVSSASGAGQFINDTWNRVTGGAPMTKGYQDAATKELAAQDYKARTGRELDADLREKGLAPDIIKTLAPTWTSLGNAPSPPMSIGDAAANARNAPSSGAEGKKSIGDVVTSEGFIVPALGFLGSMLASNRPNLGQALGEGIMGGVGAYQSQQKQLAEIAKTKAETGQMLPVATARNIEAANKLATGLMQYNASLPPGSPKLTLQQYAKIVGYEGPLPSAAEQTTSTATKEPKPAGAAPGEVKVAEPSSRNWSFSPDEKETLVITYPDRTVLPASKDPLYLGKYADRYTTMGEGWAKEQAEAARKSAEEIVRSGKTVDVNGNVVSLPGAIESGQKQKIGEGLAKEALEFNDAAQKYRSEAQNILGVLDDLGKNYAVLRSGPDSAARANFDRMMKLIDPNKKFPNIHPDGSWDAGRYDKAVKDAFQLSIAQLTALSPRAPKAELDTLARTIPLPGLDAGAIQDLIGDAKARVEWNMKLHDSFDVNRDLDLNKFKKKFEADTPFDKFKAEVKKTIPAAAGTQQQREQAAIPQSDLVAGKVYKDASGAQKKWTGSGWENP
jgi:muramidase (phage lysozyme)